MAYWSIELACWSLECTTFIIRIYLQTGHTQTQGVIIATQRGLVILINLAVRKLLVSPMETVVTKK